MAGLDPDDWGALRTLGHRMLDEAFDHVERQAKGDGPVWRPMPDAVRHGLRNAALPRNGDGGLEQAWKRYREAVQPYALNNTHPRFMGWVHGAGTAVGMLAEMLAASLNANLGGRDHAPVEVERCVVRWAAEMLDMPAGTGGLLVTGSSMANMIAVLVARRAAAGSAVRREGVGGRGLVGYAARTAHGCIPRAFDMAGLGTDALRTVPEDGVGRLDPVALRRAIVADRAAGLVPFVVCATAGTVDTGTVDDLRAIGAVCREERIWFHVDGAFGAMVALSPTRKALVDGIGNADSVAFDFHKWAQVPYDAGCVLVRDRRMQQDTFGQERAYLNRAERGAAGNAPWFRDLGPDLSRGFRALKVWFTLQAYGTERFGRMVDGCCAVAEHLGRRVGAEPDLELLAPVRLNIVCFRVRAGTGAGDAAEVDRLNEEIVQDLHERGIAVPSTTTVRGVRAIRAAIFNHRTETADADALVDAVLMLAREREREREREAIRPG